MPVVVLADTNARMGPVVSQAVGSAFPEVESVAGELIHELLLGNALVAPSTMEAYLSGTQAGPGSPREGALIASITCWSASACWPTCGLPPWCTICQLLSVLTLTIFQSL